jgi:hypothetical protein
VSVATLRPGGYESPSLCSDYLNMLTSRRRANYHRTNRYQWTLLVAVAAIVFTTGELGLALAARLN